MTKEEFEQRALETLGELFRKNPSKAAGYYTALMEEDCVPESVKQTISAAIAVYDNAYDQGGVSVPFAKRETVEDVVKKFDMDPEVASQCYHQMRNTEIANRVIERMGGSDADRPLQEPTMRDQISAAVDLHQGDSND